MDGFSRNLRGDYGSVAGGETMRNTVELLIVSAIGGYCLMRMYELMPGVIAEAQALLAAGLGRVRAIQDAVDNAE
jgi:hypothetical protein